MAKKKIYFPATLDADETLVKLGIHCDVYRYDYPAIIKQLEEYKSQGKEDDYYGLARDIALQDLFFFGYYILKLPIAHPFLLARMYDVQDDADGTIDLWARGHWKAIDINEPVLTPDGWKKHGDLCAGDKVYGGDGFPVNVLGRTEVFYDAPCCKITFDDGYSVVASENHLWTVERRTRKRDFYKRKYRETVTLTTKEVMEHGFEQDNRLSVWVSPIENTTKDLPVDPYVLGVWLGDGHSAGGRVTNKDEEVWRGIENAGYKLSTGCKGITKGVYGLQTGLKSIGVFNNKHIPEIYKLSSISQREELLKGLMDTDGDIDARGTATFCNINERLIDDVFEICVSLGLKPTKREHNNMKLGRMYKFYNVSFQAYENNNIFSIGRKKKRLKKGKRNTRKYIVSCEPVESIPVSCIQVDNDGTYLVGKHLTLTHNSTFITFARTLWDLLHNPNKRICIFSHTRTLSKGHMRVIKHTLEQNEMLQKCFPEIIYDNPMKDAPKWDENFGLYVKRTKIMKEPSIYASGLVDGLPVGLHFTDHIYDDIIEVKHVSSVMQIQKAEMMFAQSQFLLDPEGSQRIVGTRYHNKDIYGKLIGTEDWKVRLYPAEVDPDGNAAFGGIPVYMSRKDLDKKYKLSGEYEYSSQMLQNPVAVSEQNFKVAWLKKYTDLPNINKVIIIDAASSKKKESDFTIMAVIGVDWLRNFYLVDMVRDKLSLKEKWEKLKDLVDKHKCNDVYYEQFGAMADVDYMEEQMQMDSKYFNIVVLKGTTAKTDRIGKLMPLFQNSRFWIPRSIVYYGVDGGMPRDLIEEFIDEEYSRWPFSKHDDILDCLARVADKNVLLTAPTQPNEKKEDKKPYDPLASDKSDYSTSWMSI